MTRRRQNARQARRMPRPQVRRSRRTQRRQTRAVLPPATTLYGHILRSVVQTAWDITQGALSVPRDHYAPDPTNVIAPSLNPTSWTLLNIDNGYLLAQGWLDRFKGLFVEIKVHSITAHYMPYDSPLSIGEYVFGLWDYGQDAMPSTFLETLGLPSSIVRKQGQPAKLVWYPTEPDDRNWIPLTSNHKWCSCVVFEAENTYAFDEPASKAPKPVAENSGIQGKIIIELDASYRGKPKKPSPGQEGRDAPSTSDEFKQYQKNNPCTCRKCMPRILRSLLAQFPDSHQGSPFHEMDCGAPP